MLLNQIVSFAKLDKIFIAKPPEDGAQLPILSKTEVNSQLTKKFKEITKNFNAENIRERLLSPDQIHHDNQESNFECEEQTIETNSYPINTIQQTNQSNFGTLNTEVPYIDNQKFAYQQTFAAQSKRSEDQNHPDNYNTGASMGFPLQG